MPWIELVEENVMSNGERGRGRSILTRVDNIKKIASAYTAEGEGASSPDNKALVWLKDDERGDRPIHLIISYATLRMMIARASDTSVLQCGENGELLL